eukprot:563387-Prymnesium_polylepis.1
MTREVRAVVARVAVARGEGWRLPWAPTDRRRWVAPSMGVGPLGAAWAARRAPCCRRPALRPRRWRRASSSSWRDPTCGEGGRATRDGRGTGEGGCGQGTRMRRHKGSAHGAGEGAHAVRSARVRSVWVRRR